MIDRAEARLCEVATRRPLRVRVCVDVLFSTCACSGACACATASSRGIFSLLIFGELEGFLCGVFKVKL
jgi:hypothetical protein